MYGPKTKYIKMKFRDAPKGARFKFDKTDKFVWIVLRTYQRGEVAQWNGNITGHQSLCCFVDESYTLDLIIYVIAV